MYPGNGPAITQSNAEKLLYPIFRDKLDNSYHVYHSRWWQFKYRTGETDFLIVHPIQGILVVEVKGGRIEYDNFSDAWYTNGKRLNKSPYVQAEDTCKQLVRFLKDRFDFFKSRNFTYKFCVLFPDIDEIIDRQWAQRGVYANTFANRPQGYIFVCFYRHRGLAIAAVSFFVRDR